MKSAAKRAAPRAPQTNTGVSAVARTGERESPRPQPGTQRAPLQHFFVAPENARAGEAPIGIDELAANIEVYGLLQPLVAYCSDDGRWAVADGARRLAALQALAARGVTFTDVPFREIDQERALAASLAANTQRVDLSPVDAALQWNRMTLDGRPIDAIARAFGVTERFVKGRIRLAGLYEPILDALKRGDISLDLAQLYATAEISRQEKTWKALGKQNTNAWRVREELKKNTLLAGDALARFLGEEAYCAAGGVIEHELFKTPDLSRWLDPALAERLALEKLKAEAAKLEAEGFIFVEAAIEIPFGKYADGNLGKPRKPNDEEKARLAAIKQREKALADEFDRIRDLADKQDRHHTDEEEARFEEIENEQADLRAERNRIERGLKAFDDAAKRKSGITVTLDDDGKLDIRRGVIAPKERKSSLSAQTGGKGAAAKSGKAASAKPSKPEPQAPMTNATHEKTSRIASIIVGRALAQRPDIALIALTAALAREVFGEDLTDTYIGHEALTIGRAGQRPDLGDLEDALLSAPDYEAERKRWLVALGKPAAKLEARMTTWPQDDVLDLLAFCVGESVKVVETNAAAQYDEHDARERLMLLGRLAGANPAAHFIPSAEYLEGYSKASLEAAATELAADAAGVKGKAGLAALIADRAKGAGATAAWTPPLLRTLCGVIEEPKPKAKLSPSPRGEGAGGGEKPAAAKPKAAAKPAAPKKAKPVKKPAAKPAAKGARK